MRLHDLSDVSIVAAYTADSAVKRLETAGLKPKRRSNRVYFDDPDGLEVQVAAP